MRAQGFTAWSKRPKPMGLRCSGIALTYLTNYHDIARRRNDWHYWRIIYIFLATLRIERSRKASRNGFGRGFLASRRLKLHRRKMFC
jgi:hypothetical protein